MATNERDGKLLIDIKYDRVVNALEGYRGNGSPGSLECSLITNRQLESDVWRANGYLHVRRR